MKKKILIHQCCAICSAAAAESIGNEFETTSFWYNPNIAPVEEISRRRVALEKFNEISGIATIKEEPPAGYELPALPRPERCAFCYESRLMKTASVAASRGFELFTTTLLASPYQEHDLAAKIARAAAEKHNIEFVYFDARAKYYEGRAAIARLGLYRQQYCGCAASREERFSSSPRVKKI